MRGLSSIKPSFAKIPFPFDFSNFWSLSLSLSQFQFSLPIFFLYDAGIQASHCRPSGTVKVGTADLFPRFSCCGPKDLTQRFALEQGDSPRYRGEAVSGSSSCIQMGLLALQSSKCESYLPS